MPSFVSKGSPKAKLMFVSDAESGMPLSDGTLKKLNEDTLTMLSSECRTSFLEQEAIPNMNIDSSAGNFFKIIIFVK